ncbi:MAG: ABC transporter substrate-binding protein [Acidobacteria bacterium]|nr:ABC transporter substrate-binding protein [Acidobacteriota bacterium]
MDARAQGIVRSMGIVCVILVLSQGVAGAAASALAIRDQTGRMVTLGAPARRVVSLAPNMTEMLYAVGASAVGDTTACDYPDAARQLPKVGGMDPDYESIAGLRPDLILATTSGNRMEAVDYLRTLGYPVYTSDPASVDAVLAAMVDVGILTGRRDTAETAVSAIREKLKAAPPAHATPDRPRVLCLIWPEPIMTVGGDTFVHDLIERAGGLSSTASLPHGWPILDRESFLMLKPDVIVLAAAAGRMNRESLPRSLLDLTGSTPVAFVDENLLLRPGPRVGDAVVRLREILAGARP